MKVYKPLAEFNAQCLVCGWSTGSINKKQLADLFKVTVTAIDKDISQ